MPQHDDATPLRHMLEASGKVVRFVAGCARADLDKDEKLSLSLVRLLEIIGEAATRVSKQTRAANPGVLWSEIIGMRDRLIHGYDVVDLAFHDGIIRWYDPVCLNSCGCEDAHWDAVSFGPQASAARPAASARRAGTPTSADALPRGGRRRPGP